MSPRVDQFAVPAPFRWLGAAAVCAAALAAISRLRDKARQPKVAPMSDDWLARHAADRRYHPPDRW